MGRVSLQTVTLKFNIISKDKREGKENGNGLWGKIVVWGWE